MARKGRGAGKATTGDPGAIAAHPDWPAARPEWWPLERIKPYENNPRVHPREEIAALAADMLADSVTMPILVDEDGIIIAGHGRLAAAQLNHFPHYPVVVARGWTEEQKRSARIRDNQRTLMGTWHVELLKTEINDLKLSGYDLPLLGLPQSELAGLGLNVEETAFPKLTAGDRPHFQQMTFTLHDSQVEKVKAALALAKEKPFGDVPNENSNGNALARICDSYQRESNSAGSDKSGRRKRNGKAAPLQRENSRQQSTALRRLS